jgi:hypothetical protein
MENTAIDKFFRDERGEVVIAQPPNLPLTVGLTAFILQAILPAGSFRASFELVAFGALFTWAWLELFQGVNYFRRSLGFLGLVGLFLWQLF